MEKKKRGTKTKRERASYSITHSYHDILVKGGQLGAYVKM